MIVDCHVHVCATTPGHGSVSQVLLHRLYFRLLRRLLGLTREDGPALERDVEAKLAQTLDETPQLDAAVVLAFDAVHDADGRLDADRTHLYVTNDYVAELAGRHPKMLPAASIHPYRKDAVAELERCVGLGAVLVKWLPTVQDFNPADERCLPFYEALAHHRMPLLCHTGGENALPVQNEAWADPMLLVPALARGVTVIAAHCGTRAQPFGADYLPAFCRLAREYERLYGDTAALNLPTRSYGYETILRDEAVRRKLVHSSDWPILPIPTRRIGWGAAWRLLWHEPNWLRRDVLVKQGLGLGEDYWQRGATVLRLPDRFRAGGGAVPVT
jgi:predicted TIM-barrel fold metal-dependent hydrolase